MGEIPEQPNEESMKDQEKTLEKSTLPEQYDEAAWEKLKLERGQGSPAAVINKGKEWGVSQEELERFAQDVIAQWKQSEKLAYLYDFMKNMGIGTAEELRDVGEQAYNFFLDRKDFVSALEIAEKVFGKNSEEWEFVNKAHETEQEKMEGAEGEEQELNVVISKNATFADLFSAIDEIESETGVADEGKLFFDEELLDNFSEELFNEVLSFRDEQADKAKTTKVLDFFKQRGYKQKEVSAFLPIKFKRERKK